MMRVDRQRMPVGFYTHVTKPGRKWLQTHSSGRPPSYWTRYCLPFCDAYHNICAYTMTRRIGVRDMEIDHFFPIATNRRQCYVWKNYRLSAPGYNRLKKAVRVADPFAIPRDACRLHLHTGKIYVDTALPRADRALLDATIKVLDLNADDLCERRARACSRYLRRGDVQTLAEDSPFVAYEMLRQNFLDVADRAACVAILHHSGFSWV